MKKNYYLALVLTILVLATGCSGSKTVLPYFKDLPAQSGELPTLPYLPTIQPDDELQISITSSDPSATAIFNQPEVNPATRPLLNAGSNPRMLSYVVSSDGYIEIPNLGRIYVLNKTVEQLQQEITEMVKRSVIDPQVIVRLVNFTVVVAGEVNQPSTIAVPRNRFTILEALSAAGDMTVFGERSNVLLIRENNGEREYVRLNLNESDFLTSPYYYLQPNDYIYVTPNHVRQDNSKYNQNNGFKLNVISTCVSAASVVASLIIALTVK